MKITVRLALLGLLPVAGLAVMWSARADGDDAPVLHEDVTPPPGAAERRAEAERGALVGPEPTAGRNPAAFSSGDKLLPEPSLGAEPNGREPIHGTEAFAADRDTQWRPDRITEMDGTLRYVEVFNPSIVPFKRMSAMDGVRSDFTLYVRKSAQSDLPVGGKDDPQRDKFWGSMVVQLKRGQPVAIPSVAPDMRILSYETEPRTSVIFSKDASDNYYLRSEDVGDPKQVRVNFLVDAPALYFAPEVDRRVRVRDIDRSMVPPLPPETRESAERAVRQLGLSRNMRVYEALEKMTYYFRGFEAKDPPPPTRDIFWDLFASQAGVCRHRSFAFVVVAHALGIPARYVTNEAHAWVEVWVPRRDGQDGWLRYDLGGAALELEVSNAEGKTMYQPRAEDSFEKPPSYLNNYSRLEGDVEGLNPRQLAEARAAPSGQSSGDGVLPEGQGAGEAGSGEAGDSGEDRPESGRRMAPGPGSDLPPAPGEEVAGKQATNTEIRRVSTVGFRGETFAVSGRVHDDNGVGLPGLHIDVYIAPRGAGGDDARWIGQGLSGADGLFSVELAVPGDMTLGSYEVYAGTSGNDTYAPSISK